MAELISVVTSTEVAEQASTVALLPVGSFEQHGAYLPLSTDTIVAAAVADQISRDYGLFLLPPITMSCSHEHAGWPGTVSISSRTLHLMIDDIRESLARSRVETLVLVNGHGGNYVLSNIVQEANVDGPRMALFPGRAGWQAARDAAGLVSTLSEDMHGGELETSILLHVRPDAVRPGNETADWTATDRPHLLVRGMRGYTETGIIGRPSLGTREKGGAILASLSRSFAGYLDALGVQTALDDQRSL